MVILLRTPKADFPDVLFFDDAKAMLAIGARLANLTGERPTAKTLPEPAAER
jgi:hypothetical protein